ncbi:MAG: (d)CMP kinase [Candidatus Omnitrophica bacterium]|nr:(d)CMP kinase [Candidatus Omnitrophota bacterium]
MIIAIDGPAGAGKSTVSKILAKKLGFLYIDTGAMYRALTLKAIQNNIDVKDTAGLIALARQSQIDLRNEKDGSLLISLDGKDVTREIRQPRITKLVSDIAKIKEVRQVMLGLQRKLGREKDSVLDGRDIGTVVFPDADKKFYIDADFKERARRRYKELRELNQPVTPQDIEADVANRDNIDSTREFAPLKKADDAIFIDTTHMTIAEVVETLLKYIKSPRHHVTTSPE